MKHIRFFSLVLLSLLPALSAQTSDSQKTYRFTFKNRTWTIKADRIERKGAMFYFRGNVKATSDKGDKISADTATLSQIPHKEKLILSPVIHGCIIKD